MYISHVFQSRYVYVRNMLLVISRQYRNPRPFNDRPESCHSLLHCTKSPPPAPPITSRARTISPAPVLRSVAHRPSVSTSPMGTGCWSRDGAGQKRRSPSHRRARPTYGSVPARPVVNIAARCITHCTPQCTLTATGQCAALQVNRLVN